MVYDGLNIFIYQASIWINFEALLEVQLNSTQADSSHRIWLKLSKTRTLFRKGKT